MSQLKGFILLCSTLLGLSLHLKEVLDLYHKIVEMLRSEPVASLQVAIKYALAVLEASVIILGLGLVAGLMGIIDKAGGAVAILMGYAVFFAFGRAGIAALFIFMAVSGLATRYKYEYKRSRGVAQAKSGIRGWRNVVGNGLIPTIAALIALLNPAYRQQTLAAFLGSVSAVFADTLATEIGLLYRGKPRLLIGLRETETGRPGGITPYGFAGVSIAIAILTGSMLFFFNKSILGFLSLAALIAAAGLVGCLADSAAGQLIQGLYKCRTCGQITEYKSHCGDRCMKVRGLTFVDNHVVNIIGASVGALVAFLLTYVLEFS